MVIKYRRDVLCFWEKVREVITCTYSVILPEGEIYEMDAFLTLQIK